MKLNYSAYVAACFIVLFFPRISSAQALETRLAMNPRIVYTRPESIVHQYPLTGAREVPTRTDIGIRAIGAYDQALLAGQRFVAIGSISGTHVLTAHLSRDHTVAIFHAVVPFAYGEDVHFAMNATLAGGTPIVDSVRFTTMVRPAPASIPDWVCNEVPRQSLAKGMIHTMSTEDDSLPEITVNVDDRATPGTIYFDNFGFNPIENACYLFNCDEHGTIIRDREQPGESSRDFTLQPNGMRTYYDLNAGAFLGMDSAWNVIDTFASLNYATDEHELVVFADGSYALLGLSMTNVDMAQYVPGGYDSALVYGDVIQKFDPDGNLVFEWRGIDHYNVYDSKYEDLTASEIDFEHANSLDFDSSGNVLLSNRHLCEISQINGVTGDFIWRLGGAHNQFTLVGDSMWFSFQHDARWLPDGNLTCFDNSNYDTIMGGNGTWIQKSRAVEYALDTAVKTATLIWQYHHTPETWTDAMGDVERLPNGNTFIGWGDNVTVSMTEIRPDNSTAFELTMGGGNVSYRALKFLPDSLIRILDTASASVSASGNNGGNALEIEAGGGGTLLTAYSLDQSQLVSMTIYDVTGRAVRNVLVSQFETAGFHEAALDLTCLPEGAYECALHLPNATIMKSFCFLK